MAITACNQPIQRPQGGGTNPADDSIAALAYLGIETAFSAAPDIVPQMSAGTAAAPKSLSEATSPEKGYFVLYPDGPGGEVRILAQTKAGAFIRDASVNGTTIAAETDEPAANEDDDEDGEDEEPDGEEPAEPALLAYVFTVNGAGYTAFKLTVVDEASGESADYTVTLQPSSMSGTGTALDDLTGRLYDDPEGDITKLYAGLATHTTQLDTLILALDELEVNAQIAMLTEKTLEGGGPWQADITGAAFIYIQFNDGGRFHPVPKDSLGAASILLADGGGTASFTVNSDTLTITVAGSGEPAALYAGTNSADCQSLVLLKQQFDLLDTALEATYLTQASFNSALTSYYTKTQIEGNYTATADLAAWVQTNALGSYSTTAAMDTAIADAISDALADFDDGDAVDAKIEAVRDALAESIGDLDTALTSLTSKVTALEAGTAAFVLDSAKATLIQGSGFASNNTAAAELDAYFKTGKRYYLPLSDVSSGWANMPLTGSITGTLTFVRSGDILTVTLAVSRIGSDYQYREYRGMWLLTESAFTWQAPAGATLGWVPIVTGSTGQLSVGVSTWDSGDQTNGRVTASKSVNVVNVQVKLKNGTTYSTGTLIATLPEAYRPTQALSQVVGASGWGQGTVSILTDGSVKAKTSANVLDDGGGESRYQFTWIAPNADPAHVLSVDSVDFSSQITGEAWTTGINKSAIYDPVSGIVRISGTVSSSLSNLSIDSNCLTVPAEYRPLTAQYGNFSFYYNVGGTYCIMQPSGVLEFYSSSARPSSQSSGGVYSITYMVPKTGGAYVLTKPSALTGAAFTWAQSFTFTVTGSALEFAGVGKLINVSLSNKDPGANVNVSGTGTYKLGTIDAAYRPSATIAGTAIKTAQASSYLWQPHITPSGEVWLKPAGDTGGLDNTCVFTFSYWAP